MKSSSWKGKIVKKILLI